MKETQKTRTKKVEVLEDVHESTSTFISIDV